MHKPKEKLAGVVTDMTLELPLLSLELPIWPHRMCVKVWDERERQIVGGGMKCVSNFFFFFDNRQYNPIPPHIETTRTCP